MYTINKVKHLQQCLVPTHNANIQDNAKMHRDNEMRKSIRHSELRIIDHTDEMIKYSKETLARKLNSVFYRYLTSNYILLMYEIQANAKQYRIRNNLSGL